MHEHEAVVEDNPAAFVLPLAAANRHAQLRHALIHIVCQRLHLIDRAPGRDQHIVANNGHALHVQRDNLTGFVLVEFLCSFLHELKILHNISPSDNSLGFGKRFQPRNGLQRQRMHGFPAAAQIVR